MKTFSVSNSFKRLFPVSTGLILVAFISSSCTTTRREKDRAHVIEISVPEQRMALYREGKPVKYFPVSTSKFGLGDEPGSNRTPLGKFEIAEKIGDKKPAGAVFKSRKFTGEVVKPNSPGRDPIVSRIFWLKGTQPNNRNAFSRYIYIHGTPEERTIGTPASYGCIRMKSRDVIDLYKEVGWGADVWVVNKPLWRPQTKPVEPQLAVGAGSAMAMTGTLSNQLQNRSAATSRTSERVAAVAHEAAISANPLAEVTRPLRKRHNFTPVVAQNVESPQ